jgi:hypothetical protein
LLSDDPESDVAARANATLDALPAAALAAFLARPDVPAQMRDFFQARGVIPAGDASRGGPADATSAPAAAVGIPPVDAAPVDAAPVGAAAADAPLAAADEEIVAAGDDDDEEEDEETSKVPLSSLSIVQRMKLGMKGSKAQRSQLIRDSNKLVAAAVLSSPKLTESEVEAFSKMANVSEEVLRTIAMNRTWTKNYGVIAGLAKNPKTPPSISMQLVPRLNPRDLKMLSTDRNSPEVIRNMAKRLSKKELL